MTETDGVKKILVSTPDDLINQFLQYGSSINRNRWAIGDAANLLTEMHREAGTSIMDAYLAASIWLNREVSARTVMYYAMCARSFPPHIRDTYPDIPFSHFALAHSYDDRWQEVLDLSSRYAGEHGYYPSSSWIRYQMEISGEIPDEPESRREDSDNSEPAPREEILIKKINSLIKILKKFPLPDYIRDRALQALDELIKAVQPEMDIDILERE